MKDKIDKNPVVFQIKTKVWNQLNKRIKLHVINNVYFQVLDQVWHELKKEIKDER
jgi:hypothetical protein